MLTLAGEQVGNVVLFLSLLSSAVVLKTPMPAYLPPAAEARERLVVKLRDLEVVRRRLVRGGSESLLYYAYIISMKVCAALSSCSLSRR